MLTSGEVHFGYRIHREVARTRSAVVYRAERVADGVPVALKILTLPSIRRRLLEEGRLLQGLHHPHIVSVVEVLPDLPGLALEWVEGPTLARRLRDVDCFDPAEAERLFRGILAGVSAAHVQRIVHRDLKPANVLLEPTDEGLQPRIIDLGIARVEGEHRSLTISGDVLGTAGYMAPEQFEDPRSVDARADVFSLGVIFYEMLTGARPFTGVDLEELQRNICGGAYVPLDVLVPGVSPVIAKVITRSLIPDREKRASSCEVLRRILDDGVAWTTHLSPGDTIRGRYTVRERVDGGGVATIYRLEHDKLGTPFALKVVTNPTDPLHQARLMAEGRIQAAIQHPNILRVVDMVDVRGVTGLVMEYIGGGLAATPAGERPAPRGGSGSALPGRPSGDGGGARAGHRAPRSQAGQRPAPAHLRGPRPQDRRLRPRPAPPR